MSNNIESIVQTVLVKNNFRDYAKKDFDLQLQIHPNYPSFQSITDTLDYFNIDNIAVEVPIDALDQLPECFISLVTIEGAEEIVAVIRKEHSVELKHTTRKQKKLTYEEFKEVWVPKVIAVEYQTKKNLTYTKTSFQNILIGLGTLSLVGTVVFQYSSPAHIITLILSLAGLVTSYFAFKESMGEQSQRLHQFCTTISSTGCSEVIKDSSGRLFKNFTLADASIAYFLSLSLFLLLFGYQDVLLLPFLAGIPVVVYSLYSQSFIIKQWCAICVSISAISTALIAIGIFTLDINAIQFNMLLQLLFVSSLATLSYIFIKNKITENKDYKSDNIRLNKFKRDKQIFEHLYEEAESISETDLWIDNEIVLGNPKTAKLHLITLTNPMCGFCKGAFEAYSKVAKSLRSDVSIRIRLKVAFDDPKNQATQISLRLLEIYNNKGEESFMEAYNEWFNDRTLSKWIKKYGAPATKNEKFIEVLKAQSNWAERNNLFYTPATILNHKVYPKKYNYEELYHFTTVLLESEELYHSNPSKID